MLTVLMSIAPIMCVYSFRKNTLSKASRSALLRADRPKEEFYHGTCPFFFARVL